VVMTIAARSTGSPQVSTRSASGSGVTVTLFMTPEIAEALRHMLRVFDASQSPAKQPNAAGGPTAPQIPYQGPRCVLFGKEHRSFTKKQVYVAFWRTLAELAGDSFPHISKLLRRPRGRRPYLARSPQDLFPDNPALADFRYYFKIPTADGAWYIDTNLSGVDMRSVIRRACCALGLKAGSDFTVTGF
jgi:hypothetical protein